MMRYLFLIFLSLPLIGCGNSNEDETTLVPLTQRFDKKTQSYAFVIENLDPVSGALGLKAQECGVCHISIYNEWKASTHATALRDIQFQAELAKPDSPKWICLNCHIPVQNQREYIVTHLEDGDIFRPVKTANKKFDPELQQESITCATCHVRWDRRSKTTYIVGPNGSTLSPHPVKKDRQALRNMCQRCHNPRGEGLTRNLICWFETTRELAEAAENVRSAFGEGRDCVDCHMPTQKGYVADAMTNLPRQEVNQHHWVGSGIPKWYKAYDSLLARGYESGLEVSVDGLEIDRASRQMKTKITLTNARAGHYLPTADPERFLLTLAFLENQTGERLQVEKLRIGQEWKWNPARKVGDNRLRQGESFVWDMSLSLPDALDGVKLVVITYHVRLTAENAKHMILTKNVNEHYLANGRHLVKNITDYYPFATCLFKEEIDLKSKKRRKYSIEELIDLSKREKGKALSKRDY